MACVPCPESQYLSPASEELQGCRARQLLPGPDVGPPRAPWPFTWLWQWARVLTVSVAGTCHCSRSSQCSPWAPRPGVHTPATPPPGAACPQPAPHGETVVELGGVQGGAGRLGGVGEWTAGLLSLDRKSGMKAGPSGTCECGLDRRGFSGQGAVAGRVLGRVSRRVWEPGTPDVGDVVNIHTPSSIPCDPPGRPLTVPVWPVWGLLQT